MYLWLSKSVTYILCYLANNYWFEYNWKHILFRSSIEENNSKLLSKLAKQAGSCCVHGTFAPIWNVLKTSAERLSALHIQMVQKVTDLVKEVSKYADELHKKHKQVSLFTVITFL